jgi:hypothetical protein
MGSALARDKSTELASAAPPTRSQLVLSRSWLPRKRISTSLRRLFAFSRFQDAMLQQ